MTLEPLEGDLVWFITGAVAEIAQGPPCTPPGAIGGLQAAVACALVVRFYKRIVKKPFLKAGGPYTMHCDIDTTAVQVSAPGFSTHQRRRPIDM